ncbi:uncharacterized protein LOC105800927 [Gossypium raimondii]|uniref:uncharacterized protein LOC105800927 n=1 Tax=Gossypium raimondii TaxID=29730 RepID=UPI00227A6BA6|nr:uncharacterized protein LOC105800927 [Gossypium raimondii]
MASNSGRGYPTNGSIYVCNLPEGTDENSWLLDFVAFFGASNSDETESVMKLLWDLINPGTDSSIERKDSLAVLTAMISGWSFLLSTIDGWRLSHKNWQGAITYFSNILDSNDEALCAAACEALALVVESNCLEKFSSKTKDSNKEFKDNIIKQLEAVVESSNERISSQDPRTGSITPHRFRFPKGWFCVADHLP